MKSSPFLPFITVTLLGFSGMLGAQVTGFGEESELTRLQRTNDSLARSLVAVETREKESSTKLKEIELRLEAMGDGLLEGGDDRLVKAVSDLEVMSRKLKAMEDAALALSSSTQQYLSTAIAADPEARLEVETRIRDLDAIIGLREAPKKDRKLGNLQQAQVVSVDTESTIVVVNVGDRESAAVGMPFEVYRNDSKVAEALVAQTRNDVSALLITSLENEANPVRRGDRVSLKRN